jgi:glycosyltransferase domain-containing protein
MKLDNVEDITLLIPTKNRTIFLKRVLTYYKKVNFKGTLAIGDSSTGDFLIDNKKIYASMKDFINITYQIFPDKNLCQTSHELLKTVKTNFVAEVHDDNFIVPNSIKKCIEFLNHNSDYSAARGLGISLKTKNDEPYGKLIKCVKKKQPSSELDSASSRLMSLYGDYSDIHYAIHRTEIYREVLKNSHIKDNNFFHIMTTANTFILGKVKELDILHVIRHIQSPQGRRVFNKNHPESRNTYWWITGEEWGANLEILKKSIVNNLIKIDKITPEEAQKAYELSFFMYFSMYFAYKSKGIKDLKVFFDGYYSSALFPFVFGKEMGSMHDNKFMKLIMYVYPRFKFIVAKFQHKVFGGEILKSKTLNWRTNSLLPSLLDKKSKYHSNFIPIYELITNGSE